MAFSKGSDTQHEVDNNGEEVPQCLGALGHQNQCTGGIALKLFTTPKFLTVCFDFTTAYLVKQIFPKHYEISSLLVSNLCGVSEPLFISLPPCFSHFSWFTYFAKASSGWPQGWGRKLCHDWLIHGSPKGACWPH